MLKYHDYVSVRWLRGPCEVGGIMAAGCAPVLHRAQLHPAPLASLVHGHLHLLHALDRHLLLSDGVDGTRA